MRSGSKTISTASAWPGWLPYVGCDFSPPVYPTLVEMTPSRWRSSSWTPQKQTPARMAVTVVSFIALFLPRSSVSASLTHLLYGGAGERPAAGGHLDGAEQMRGERHLAVGGAGVGHRRVHGAPAGVAVAPRDGVVGAHRGVAGVVGALVERREDVDAAARVRAEGVPLVDATPDARHAAGGRRAGVLDDAVRRRRARSVAAEARADQADVPGPAGEAVGGGMDAEEAAAATDVALERAPVGLARDGLSRRRQEDEGVVAGEVAVGERPLVLGLLHGEAMRPAEPPDRRDPDGDRVVAEAGGLREHEHAKARRRRRCAVAGRRRRVRRDDRRHDQHRDQHRRPAHARTVWRWTRPSSPLSSRPSAGVRRRSSCASRGWRTHRSAGAASPPASASAMAPPKPCAA